MAEHAVYMFLRTVICFPELAVAFAIICGEGMPKVGDHIILRIIWGDNTVSERRYSNAEVAEPGYAWPGNICWHISGRWRWGLFGVAAAEGYLLPLVENTKIYVNNEVAARCKLTSGAFFLGLRFVWALPLACSTIAWT